MKIYIAAKFEKKDLVLDYYQKLKALGHEVAYDWTVHKNIKPYLENQDTARVYATNELHGILDCDVFIHIPDEKGTTLFMEFGAALALCAIKNKPIIYAVGEFNSKSPWFFNSLVRRKATIEEALSEL